MSFNVNWKNIDAGELRVDAAEVSPDWASLDGDTQGVIYLAAQLAHALFVTIPSVSGHFDVTVSGHHPEQGDGAGTVTLTVTEHIEVEAVAEPVAAETV